MDAILRTVFNHFLHAFCEPLKREGVEISFVDGLVVKDLVLRPEAINRELEKADADMRVEGGRIGLLRVCYTTLPGVVTMQMNGVDIRVRPNALKTLGRVVKKGINDLLTPDDEDILPHREHPMIDPRSHAILSPLISPIPVYHQRGCPRHPYGPPAVVVPSTAEIMYTRSASHQAGYCRDCHGALPPQEPLVMSANKGPPSGSEAGQEMVYLSPKQVRRLFKHVRTQSGQAAARSPSPAAYKSRGEKPLAPSFRRTLSAKVHHLGHTVTHPRVRGSYHSQQPSTSIEESGEPHHHEPHCPMARPRASLRACHQACKPSRAHIYAIEGHSRSSDSVPQPRRRSTPLQPSPMSSYPLRESIPPPNTATMRQSPLRPSSHPRAYSAWDPPPR